MCEGNRDAWWNVCGCGVRGHIVLYDECTEAQQLYAWWMECPGGACEYVEEFAFGASLVWCRIANIWYLHIIDLHHVATYYM